VEHQEAAALQEAAVQAEAAAEAVEDKRY